MLPTNIEHNVMKVKPSRNSRLREPDKNLWEVSLSQQPNPDWTQPTPRCQTVQLGVSTAVFYHTSILSDVVQLLTRLCLKAEAPVEITKVNSRITLCV